MRKPTKKPQQRTAPRWLIGALVAAAVVIVLGIKFIVPALALSQPVPAIEVLAPTRTPLPSEVEAATPTAALVAGVAALDPYPPQPIDQVDWLLRQGKPGMVLAHSSTCIPCKQMEKIVAAVQPDYEADIAFIDVLVNDPANQRLMSRLRTMSIPTSYFVDSAGAIRQAVGVIPEENLRQVLDGLRAGVLAP